MKRTILSFLVAALLLLPSLTFAQGSWTDDFNAATIGTGWYQNSHYGLSQNDGMLSVNTQKTAMWASFGANIPVQDLTTSPVLNLSIKTAQPFQLTVYFFSAAGNVNITQPVMASEQFTTVSFDFTGLDVASNVLNAVNGIGFAFNGASISWGGTVYFDNITVGTTAVKYANLGAVPDVTFFQGTTAHKLFIRGITNAASLQLTGADALLENITIDPVSATGTTWLHFDCKAGVDASVTATLTAIAKAGYSNNSVNFLLDVEGNRPPVINNISNTQASVGVSKTIELTGIDDGNSSTNQSLSISAISDNPAEIENPISVNYTQGSRYASLTFVPLSPSITTITVTIDDGSATDNILTKTFDVEILGGWNASPTLDFISNSEVLNTAGTQTIILKGISDGDNGSQTLSLTASSSDETLIPDPLITFDGGKTAVLSYSPVAGKSGIVTFTISLSDNGGTIENNGNQILVRTFKVETYAPPLSGYVIPFTGATPEAYAAVQPGMRDYWHVEGMGLAQTPSFVKDGVDDVFQIACTGKSTWTGVWYYTPDMDLSNFPLMSMWVKCDKAIRVHIYFWDDSIRNNEDHHLEFPVLANTWTKLNFDFSDSKGMLNNKGQLVNAKRITRVLFNYHPNYNWPFTDWAGTVQFKDIRIGNESGITPSYYCTIDPVGQQTYPMGNELKTIVLKGLSRGKDSEAQVAVSSKGNLAGLNVSAVANAEATISFTPALVGTDTIKVIVSGAAIDGKTPISTTIKIPVAIVDVNTAANAVITTNPAQKHQIYRGLGAKDPSSNLLDLYTLDFGASAIRFGILDDNQVEPFNDNEDPNVLDMTKLNYSAFDWNYVRNLKARGVETFLVTFWSPPAWMKENLSTNYQQPAAPSWESTDNKVLTDMYDEYAETVLAVAKMFKQEAGIDLAGIGIQNEPAFCEPYASAILSPAKFADMIGRVGKRFAAEGITTQLYGAEQVGGTMSEGPVYNNASYLSAFDANPDAKMYSDIFAIHGYASDGITPGVPPGSAGWEANFTAINANGKTRELWMTETEPSFTNWTDAFNNSANIVTAFESGDVSLWTEWAWDGHSVSKGKATQKLWSQSMFSFIRPGASRITSASGNNDILITSWINDAEHGGKTVIVLMNKGLQPLTTSIEQVDMPNKYTVYRCSENVARFRDNVYIKGQNLLMGPKSMVTLVSGVEGEPLIDPVADQLVFMDASQVDLTLTGISDGFDINQYPVSISYSFTDNTILTGVSLLYTSPEQTGTFSFSPAKAGATEVTLTLTANEIVTTEKFNVIVKDYNLPTINAISGNLSFADNAGEQTINLSGISDGGDGGQAITVSAEISSSDPVGVIENMSVAYTSPASMASFIFTPGVAGTAQITVTVTDAGPAGKNTTTRTFLVNVFSTIGINNSQKENVKLYPSPATDKVFVDIPANVYTKYSVYSADGMLVKTKAIDSDKIEFNVSSLSKGYYLFILEGKEKSVVLNFIK